MSNFDQSHKDAKYFIDGTIYNCPFCNRRHVKYKIDDEFQFSWTRERQCFGYIVTCRDCNYKSLHLSNYELETYNGQFSYPLKNRVMLGVANGGKAWTYVPLENEDGDPMEIDDAMFHKQPTSFFTIDKRIPEKIRKPLNEADNCRVNNYLTGGSACLRRCIYELLVNQGIAKIDEVGKSLDYDARIMLLKKQLNYIDTDYFDILKMIKGVTSVELHEDPWQEFDNPMLRLLIETTKEILYRIYVEPEEKKNKKAVIHKLQEKIQQKTAVNAESTKRNESKGI